MSNITVKLSDYMESRSINKKLYRRLIDKIKENLTDINPIDANPINLEVKISMSAKYQTPHILISEDNKIPRNIGTIEQEIERALDDVGFTFDYSEEKENYYLMNFSD